MVIETVKQTKTLCNFSVKRILSHLEIKPSTYYKWLKTVGNGKNKKHNTVLKDVQYHPVTGDCLHVDLHEISLKEKIDTSIHVVYTGTAQGVKEGGIFETILREIDIRALPQDIPEHLEIDITFLEIGNSIHVRDLDASEGIEVLTDPNRTLATVIPPRVLKEEKVEEWILF